MGSVVLTAMENIDDYHTEGAISIPSLRTSNFVPSTYTLTTFDWDKTREDRQLANAAAEGLTRLLEARLRDGVVDGVEVEVDDVPNRGNDCVWLEDKLGLEVAYIDVEQIAGAYCSCSRVKEGGNHYLCTA
jgi:hypothetical protein